MIHNISRYLPRPCFSAVSRGLSDVGVVVAVLCGTYSPFVFLLFLFFFFLDFHFSVVCSSLVRLRQPKLADFFWF